MSGIKLAKRLQLFHAPPDSHVDFLSSVVVLCISRKVAYLAHSTKTALALLRPGIAVAMTFSALVCKLCEIIAQQVRQRCPLHRLQVAFLAHNQGRIIGIVRVGGKMTKPLSPIDSFESPEFSAIRLGECSYLLNIYDGDCEFITSEMAISEQVADLLASPESRVLMDHWIPAFVCGHLFRWREKAMPYNSRLEFSRKGELANINLLWRYATI